MSVLEQLVLDGLALNDATYRLQGLEMPPPKKRYEWAQGGDADGAALVRDPLFENREITVKIRITPPATMDLALAAIAAISDKLEEAEKQPDGLDLVWTPATGTNSVTFKVLSGEITELPIDMEGGWFKRSPVVVVTLVCKPFGYGPEVTGSPTTAATPFVALTVADVDGDVPAEGRLIVTDDATQVRRYLEWGLEQRHYDAATDLLIESDAMSLTGTGGAQTTRTGAYDPGAAGNNVIRATLWRGVVAVAATGNLSHVGTFRVKARVYGSGTGQVYARLAWQEGDGPYQANPYTLVHMLGSFVEIDLGIISVPLKELGTQRWAGRIEAYSETPGDTLDVDYLVLVPAGEGYGRARGVGPITASSINGYDDFGSLAPAAALNTRVAPAGGTWATSGVATDFAGNTLPPGLPFRQTTSDASPRFAILGSTDYTNMQVEVVAYYTWPVFIANVRSAVIARWTDSSNYLYALWKAVNPTNNAFQIVQVVAGVSTILASTSGFYSANTNWAIRLTAFASGLAIAELRFGTAGSAPVLTLRGYSAAIATGGALEDGKPGFFDWASGSVTPGIGRLYDWFSVGVPSAEPLVINSTRGLEVRSDTTVRADSTNTYWGPVPSYRGSRFLVPPAGSENRTSRVLVKAHRQDIETLDAGNVTDSLTVQANHTPRYLVVPR